MPGGSCPAQHWLRHQGFAGLVEIQPHSLAGKRDKQPVGQKTSSAACMIEKLD